MQIQSFKKSPSGTLIARFTIAFPSGNGKIGLISAVAFGKKAESSKKHLKKHSQVSIKGQLDFDSHSYKYMEKNMTFPQRLIAREICLQKIDIPALSLITEEKIEQALSPTSETRELVTI